MSRTGSINYLKFSPYSVSSNDQTLLSINPHWFLVQVITSIINITTFGNTMKIYFSSDNMVANGWFKMYLNREQQQFLINSDNFELYPIENLHKISLLSSLENQDCYVYASSDWEPPPGARIVSRIKDTLYRVKNLTISKEVKNDDRILTIKPISRKKLNNRYNSGFLQTHHQKSVFDHGIYAPLRSLHNIGLDGSGQVINIVDTGIDVYNPMFYDPENSLSTISGKTNLKHRKVIRIEKYADDLDYFSGHGTHVSGIAAGNAYCTNNKCGISQYNGIAPGAKIYFSDIGYSQVSGDLSEEFDLLEQGKLLSQFGCYVSSNSWSYDDPYKEDLFIYDYASYVQPNLVYLFAAGNDYSYFSINSPSCAKNVLSVGATDSVSSSEAESFASRVIIQNETFSFESDERSNRMIRSLSIDPKMTYIHNRTIVNYLKLDNTSNWVTNTDEDFKDKIIHLNFDCDTGLSAICNGYYDAVSRGASAIVHDPCHYFNCGSNTIPTIAAAKTYYDAFKTMKRASIFPLPGSDNGPLPDVAALSSKGPSVNGLSKPDFAVPGSQVTSAKSHGTSPNPVIKIDFSSSLVQMSGTSMATPAGAALAIIVRQFFVDGFYPGLKKNSGKSINPSSHLVRSMIANSAVNPTKLNAAPGPDMEVGFGIPCLEKVFGFKDSGLRLVDNVRMPSQTHHIYHIKLDSNSTDLIVSMTYLDPPLNPDNDALLFADLNLVVKSPNGKFYIGNGVDDLSDSDSFSNAERVIVKKEDIPKNGGDFEIHVLSTDYPMDSVDVNYSIVVNGPFEQAVSDRNPLFLTASTASEKDCIKGCSGNGTCSATGFCQCKDGYIGLSCNTKVIEIHDGQTDSFDYNHKQIRYYKISPKTSYPNLSYVDFSLDKYEYDSSLYFCTTTEERPGQITNAEWECHQSNKQFYSVELSLDEQFQSLYLALYISYNHKINVRLFNISFSTRERPQTPAPSKDYRKILFIGGYVVCGLVFLLLIIALIIFIVKLVKRKKKEPIADINEEIVQTVNTYDVDANL